MLNTPRTLLDLHALVATMTGAQYLAWKTQTSNVFARKNNW